MVLRLCIACLLLSSCCVAAGHCSAYPAGQWKFDAASALQFEQVWLDILQHKNRAALDCILAPDFKDTSRKGELRPRARVLQELESKDGQSYTLALADLTADLFDNTAVVHGVNIITDARGHELLRIRFTDVLQYVNHHWLAVAAQETEQH